LIERLLVTQSGHSRSNPIGPTVKRIKKRLEMTPTINRLLILVGALLSYSEATTASTNCGDEGVVLQILGSGGPFGAGRASAGYIVWIDGESRIMVDAGGGTFARFHEAGANVSDLKVLALSHFHPDHSSEVPALLWAQASTLLIAGPSGNKNYPSLDGYLRALFAPPDGAFRVIGGYLEAETVTVDAEADEPTEVYSDGHISIRGIGVPHSNVPTIGYSHYKPTWPITQNHVIRLIYC
jgi:ribonuclease BN (tRNA processing enzyme)